MSDVDTPSVVPAPPSFTELAQVSIKSDSEIDRVNELLRDGWRLVSVGYRPDATVFVLGRTEEKPRHRAGFLA